jgi:hypothetical protein
MGAKLIKNVDIIKSFYAIFIKNMPKPALVIVTF